MEKTAMQPVIMAKWRGRKPGRLSLMITDDWNNGVVLFHCKKVTEFTHFNRLMTVLYLVNVVILKTFMTSNPIFTSIYDQHFFLQ